MTSDVRELLPLYALGILDPDEAAQVERAISGDAALARELAAHQQATELLVAPVAPSADVKLRLMASIGGGRFDAFAARVAAMFDVALERGRELLGLIERPASWIAQIPGVSLVHFEGGPATAAADCGFVRLAPGAVFPPHNHLGDESCIVLSGQMHDPVNNRTLGPGDGCALSTGSAHYLICVGDEPCIYASRADNGIALGPSGGERIKPMT